MDFKAGIKVIFWAALGTFGVFLFSPWLVQLVSAILAILHGSETYAVNISDIAQVFAAFFVAATIFYWESEQNKKKK